MIDRALVARGRELVAQTPTGDLPIGFRCRLLRGVSKAVRVQLAVVAVQKVIPIWEREFGEGGLPTMALAVVGQFMRGEIDAEVAKREGMSVLNRCEALEYKEGRAAQVAASVASAGAHAVFEAISDVPLACRAGEEDTILDSDTDPYEHDAEYFAAVAFANGPAWDPQSDIERRREFWMWWLDAAVRM